MFWGNLGVSRCFTKRIKSEEFGFSFFWLLGGCPRSSIEEGGQLVFPFVCLREFKCVGVENGVTGWG
jgi:hypothetical protein